MKKIIALWIVFLLLGCNSESGLDCFKKQGKTQTQEIFTEEFTKINISEGIELIVKQTDEQKISLTFGENFINEISFDVIDGELMVQNNSGCNVLRNYHPAQVYISSPNLEKIYSASQYSIQSDGLLTYPDLTLESGIIQDTPSTIFDIWIENEKLSIHDNISSVFRIKGKTQELNIKFWGSNGRFEGEDLLADEIQVYHRSTNDMIVFPLNKISGKLLSTGNLVLKNVPEVVDIEQFFTGQVVYP